MSRGFVKEGDQEELPVIPPRAPLPPGVPNYVTPAGYQALLKEQSELEEERKAVPTENEREHRHAVTFIDGKLKLLIHRISTARILNPWEQPRNEIRFGAIVKIKLGSKEQSFQIVGVDEADIKQKKIAFTAPLARVITGKRVGEKTVFSRGREQQSIEVLEIIYPKGKKQ